MQARGGCGRGGGGTPPAQLGGMSGSGAEPQKPTLFAFKKLQKLLKKAAAMQETKAFIIQSCKYGTI